MNIYLAQNNPKTISPVQRTIEDESAVQANPVPASETQANHTVIYGLGAILLILIAVGAAAIFLKAKTQPKE